MEAKLALSPWRWCPRRGSIRRRIRTFLSERPQLASGPASQASSKANEEQCGGRCGCTELVDDSLLSLSLSGQRGEAGGGQIRQGKYRSGAPSGR